MHISAESQERMKRAISSLSGYNSIRDFIDLFNYCKTCSKDATMSQVGMANLCAEFAKSLEQHNYKVEDQSIYEKIEKK